VKDLDSDSVLSDTEKAAWNALKSVHTNFLGNHKAENYREVVSEMLVFPCYKMQHVATLEIIC
jgi:hypothetical protein